MPLTVGQTYQLDILKRLGGTACGEVFHVRTTAHGDAALKIPIDMTNQTQSKLLEQEGQILARFRGQSNIVQLLARGFFGTAPWLLIEFLQPRQPLAQQSKAESITQLANICTALNTAHQMNIVHRDIDPSNILRSGNTWKIIDWGAAYLPGSPIPTEELVRFGTPSIMAPEAWQGTVNDPRSDLYSIGCCMYFFLTGKLPFGEIPKQIVATRHQNDPIPNLANHIPGIPSDYQVLLNGLMAKDPRDRIPTAAMVSQRLLDLPPIP